MADVLMVIAPTMFRDEEYLEPKAVLEAAGARVVTASMQPGTCTGKLGATAEAEIAVADAVATDYDAVVFVGGAGAEVYFSDVPAHRLAREAFSNGRILGAICIAPTILARSGLMCGKRASAFESEWDDLTMAGVMLRQDAVTVDRPFVTANGPAAAAEFGRAIAREIRLPV